MGGGYRKVPPLVCAPVSGAAFHLPAARALGPLYNLSGHNRAIAGFRRSYSCSTPVLRHHDGKLPPVPSRPRCVFRPAHLSAGPGGVAGVPAGQWRASCGPDSRPFARRREAGLLCQSVGWNGRDPGLRNARSSVGRQVAKCRGHGSLLRHRAGRARGFRTDRPLESHGGADENAEIAHR